MRNILFVDDDPNMLSALRRMMRPMRQEWQINFVDSGQKALESMAVQNYDVIVSDMRMPGMNGADLLRTVMHDYPNTIRIAFSGQAELELVLDVTTSAHQYLSKPCNAEQIKHTIERACNLRQILANDDLQKLVSGLGSLPSMPELYLQILDKIKSENASVREIGETIADDIAMTAKILQLVNSGFFNLPQHVSTAAEAVALLGIDVVKDLVLSTKVFGGLEQATASLLNVQQMWQFSSRTGALAKRIATLESGNSKTRDYSFLAGMLHCVGKLVLASNLPQEYARIVAEPAQSQREVWQIEDEIFGHNHMDIGAYMLGLWGLGDPIVEAIAYYRRPKLASNKSFSPLTAVHIANALIMAEHDQGNETHFLDFEYLESIGIIDHIGEWQELLPETHDRGVTK